jgi:hypothetical protein
MPDRGAECPTAEASKQINKGIARHITCVLALSREDRGQQKRIILTTVLLSHFIDL